MDIDITKPHIGRIYDYVLGGTHNHEADRRAAEAMIQLMPLYPHWARQNRAFLSHVGRLWAGERRRQVLDLGSSLPTQGHFNSCMPGAKILFTDIDPLAVAQAQQILAYSSEMAYVEVDVRDPERLIAQAEAFFEDDRVLAVGCIGVVYFLSDAQIRSLVGRLHDFCAPGSALAVSYPSSRTGGAMSDEQAEILREFSRVARIDMFHRTPDQMAALLAPWRVTASEPLPRWLSQEEEPPARTPHPMDHFLLHGILAERD
jgi:hypothetical protein